MVRNRIFQVCLGMIFVMLFSGVAGAADDERLVPHVEVELRQTTLEEHILEASVILVGRVEAIGEVTHPEVVGKGTATGS